MFRLIIRNLETNLDIASRVVYPTLKEAMAVARTQSMRNRRSVRVEQCFPNDEEVCVLCNEINACGHEAYYSDRDKAIAYQKSVTYGGTVMVSYPNDLLTEGA